MPLYRRLPKRGFTNIFKKQFNIINLSQIQDLIDRRIINIKDDITDEVLIKNNIIKKRLDGIKVLGKGEIKSKIIIHAKKASKNAIKKIEKTGGKISIIKTKDKDIKKNNNLEKDTNKKEITKDIIKE